MKLNTNEKTIRYGYFDNLLHQQTIRNTLEKLIYENRPLRYPEREGFISTFSKAFFGVGVNVTVLFPTKYGKIPLGKLHYFGQKMAYLNSDKVSLSYNGNTVTVDIKELWEILFEYSIRIFPHSQAQAIRMSGEKRKQVYGEPHELGKFND